MNPQPPVAVPKLPISGVKSLIAVGSGKGGVGKTTVAVNLAVALAQLGYKAGLMDADVYGPNVPLMMGINQTPLAFGERIQPLEQFGVKLMSMGFLNPGDKPLVWRGPMLHSVIQQFLRGVDWGDLDYLVIDLPPGTGDVQLTLAQKVPVTGAIIVTTPQDIALMDARKGLKMFEKVDIKIIGIVENMSTHICSKCGHEEHIFGAGGGEKMCADYGTELLGSLPLDINIREQADSGKPSVVANPDGQAARTYRQIARRVAVKIAEMAQDHSAVFPKIVVQNT